MNILGKFVNWLNRRRSKWDSKEATGIRRVVVSHKHAKHTASSAVVNNEGQQPIAEDLPTKLIAGVLFLNEELETTQALTRVSFAEIINQKIKLGVHLYSRVAVAQIAGQDKTYVLIVDRSKVSADDLLAVVDMLKGQGFQLLSGGIQGYFAVSSLVIALSQGHIDSAGLAVERNIAKDPTKNSLLSSFTDIIAWSYIQGADDIDFVVDITSHQSQVAFKIGGKYVRPERFALPTDTLVQMLGIAWQKSSGGSAAQFQINTEQQARVELDLPKSTKLPAGARVRLRWSGMSYDKGTVVTMRLQRLGDAKLIKSLDEAGYFESQLKTFRRVINSEGGMTVFSGVVGSGKSTSLAQLLGMIPRDVKKISLEDPVELDIPWTYQKTITRDLTAEGDDPAFKSAVTATFRSALDVMLLGEIRDTATAKVVMNIVQSGHSVYTTMHARSTFGIIERLVSDSVGIDRSDLTSDGIVKLLVYQALLPKTCVHCGKSPRDYEMAKDLRGVRLEEQRRYFDRIERLYSFDTEQCRLVDTDGCEHCQREDLPELNGLSGRTVVSELLELDNEMLRLIHTKNNIDLHHYWRSLGSKSYTDPTNLIGKNAMECAVLKSAMGVIDPRQIEPRFMDFETVEIKRGSRAEVH